MTPLALKRARKSLGMNQRDFARAIGRSLWWVQSAETGRRPIGRLVELAVSALVAGGGNVPGDNPRMPTVDRNKATNLGLAGRRRNAR